MWRHSTRVPVPGTSEANAGNADAVNGLANKPGPVEPSREETQTNVEEGLSTYGKRLGK